MGAAWRGRTKNCAHCNHHNNKSAHPQNENVKSLTMCLWRLILSLSQLCDVVSPCVSYLLLLTIYNSFFLLSSFSHVDCCLALSSSHIAILLCLTSLRSFAFAFLFTFLLALFPFILHISLLFSVAYCCIIIVLFRWYFHLCRIELSRRLLQ